jgi:hypothetical protein
MGSDRRAEAVRTAKALLLGASLGIVLIMLGSRPVAASQ